MAEPCVAWAEKHPTAPRVPEDGKPWSEAEERVMAHVVGRVHDEVSAFAGRCGVVVRSRCRDPLTPPTRRMRLFDRPYECVGRVCQTRRGNGDEIDWVLRAGEICIECVEDHVRIAQCFSRPDEQALEDRE